LSRVKIITDSTSDLGMDIMQKYDIEMVPLFVTMGDKSYRDMVEISQKEIFEWADANKSTPKTSACNYVEVFSTLKKYADRGDSIIYIGISSKMSATMDVFKSAAAELPGANIHLVDSLNLSTGIGLLLLEAADMANEGKTAEEIKEELEKLVPKVRSSFVLDTVTYLYRGGRCSAVAALSAGAFKIHPQIVVTDGTMDAAQRYRGKMERVILKYAEDLTPAMRKARRKRVFITHTQMPDMAEMVRDYVESLGIFEEILITSAGGVISSHCGPGTLGILFIDGEDA
jgi:DegV family protein with EDD domain